MDIINFVKDMIDLNNVVAYLSLACIGIFLFYIIWHMLRGYRRGIVRQLFHFGFVVIAIVAAFFIADYISELSLDDFLPLFKVEKPENTDGYFAFLGIPITEHSLQFILKVLLAPIVFSLSFFVINLLLKLLYLMVIGIFHIEKGESRASKIPGLILGIIEGVVVASVVLLPLAGISGVADDTYSIVEESDVFENTDEDGESVKASIEKAYVNYIAPFSENPVLSTINKCGGDLVLDKFATIQLEEYTVNLRDELTSILRVVFIDVPGLIDIDWLSLTDSDKAILGDIVDFVSGSPYRSSIFAPLLSSLIDPSDDPMASGETEVTDAFLSVFKDLDGNSLPGVLNTFKDFYFLASDEGVLRGFAEGDGSTLTDAFTKTDENGVTTLTKMVNILESNERTAVLVNALTEMTITMLSESMGLDADAVLKYKNIKDTLNSTLTSIDTSGTKEEQVADVSASLAESFEANGMTVAPEVVNKMAENVVEKHSDGSELTDKEFNDIILNYYQANKDVTDSSAQ